MLTDESGGEGRNFQIADQVVHVDLPWTPARVEQRIGRVDRLGRTGTVLSIVPFARGTLEEDLFRLWHDAFKLFEQSMSGLEIVLEDIQDKIGNAFAQSPTEGLADLLAEMKRSAKRLREQVEEERYFEEGSIDYRRRSEFEQIAERYRDGELLRREALETGRPVILTDACLLYTSDAADERSSVDLGGRRIIKKKNTTCM